MVSVSARRTGSMPDRLSTFSAVFASIFSALAASAFLRVFRLFPKAALMTLKKKASSLVGYANVFLNLNSRTSESTLGFGKKREALTSAIFFMSEQYPSITVSLP